MLRNDGAFTFYRIQFSSNRGWRYANLDHFGKPEGFESSRPCWQETGQDGTYDEDVAYAGLKTIREWHPDTNFRLVKVSIVQTTTALLDSEPKQRSKQ